MALRPVRTGPGTLGGGIAGLLDGLLYGFARSPPMRPCGPDPLDAADSRQPQRARGPHRRPGGELRTRGGNLLGGSLNILATSSAESNVQLDRFGAFFGELHFGPTTEVVLEAIEGFLFGSCLVGAIVRMNHLTTGESEPSPSTG